MKEPKKIRTPSAFDLVDSADRVLTSRDKLHISLTLRRLRQTNVKIFNNTTHMTSLARP